MKVSKSIKLPGACIYLNHILISFPDLTAKLSKLCPCVTESTIPGSIMLNCFAIRWMTAQQTLFRVQPEIVHDPVTPLSFPWEEHKGMCCLIVLQEVSLNIPSIHSKSPALVMWTIPICELSTPAGPGSNYFTWVIMTYLALFPPPRLNRAPSM